MIDKSFHVLYVDDEPHNLSAFRARFRRHYKIFVAGSGEEAINLLRDNFIHLIITDQRMPGMTGVEFLSKIRIDFPDPIRMILTGFSDTEAIINAINDGQISRYITKPWNEKELHIAIENAREVYQLRAKKQIPVSGTATASGGTGADSADLPAVCSGTCCPKGPVRFSGIYF